MLFVTVGWYTVACKSNAKQKHPGCKKRRGQSEAAVIKQIAILATKNFDIKLRPRISQLAI